MEWNVSTPNETNIFVHTELRMPGIREYLHQKVGEIIEREGFKFKKSDFTFKKKNHKFYEEVQFLFYNYHPLNYSFNFMASVFNETIENIKQGLPPQNHFEPFNRYSVFLLSNNFTHHLISKSLGEMGSDYVVVTLDDLIAVSEAIKKTFREEVLPLLETLKTIPGLDFFFTEKGVEWAVESNFMNNIATDLIVAKLNGKRNYHEVFEDIIDTLSAKPRPDAQTIEVIKNLYIYLGNI